MKFIRDKIDIVRKSDSIWESFLGNRSVFYKDRSKLCRSLVNCGRITFKLRNITEKKLRQTTERLYLNRKCNATLRVNISPSHDVRI